MFPFSNKKCIGRRHQQHFQNRSQLRRQMRRLLFEGLENRTLLATFAEAGSLLNLDINVANTAVGIVSGGTSYTLTLTGDTWSGTESTNVTGNGSSTLIVTPSGLGVFDTVNISDSANGSAVNFNDSGAYSYGDTFNVTLDDAVGTIMFSGASAFTGMAALSASTNRNIVFSSGANVSTFGGNLTLSANQQATPTSSDFKGIDINGAIVQVNGAGNLTLLGRGGDGIGDQYGVHVRAGGKVQGGGSGTVTIDGTGGSSLGSGNHGVLVHGSGALITSSGGPVQVNGIGGGSGTSSGNHGVTVLLGGRITAGGGGTVTVQGIGGSGSGLGNMGVLVTGSGSTITSDGGAVQVSGTGGAGVA